MDGLVVSVIRRMNVTLCSLELTARSRTLSDKPHPWLVELLDELKDDPHCLYAHWRTQKPCF